MVGANLKQMILYRSSLCPISGIHSESAAHMEPRCRSFCMVAATKSFSITSLTCPRSSFMAASGGMLVLRGM
jgi:hypothetical protein